MGTRDAPSGLSRMIQGWFEQAGPPSRPVEMSGVLVKPQRRPRPRSAIQAACEPQLRAHLKAVCLWPEAGRGSAWRIGDYSTYAVEFSPAAGIEVYVQLASEPDEQCVKFRAHSGAWILPADQTVDIAKQELARDHGFETGGRRHEFEKVIAVGSARDVRQLARETVIVLCKLFGYDGRVPLKYRLYLGTLLHTDRTFHAISARNLAKLMRHWAFEVSEDQGGGEASLLRSAVGRQPFLAALVGERTEGSGEYSVIGLRAFFRFEGGVPAGFAETINQQFMSAKATVDEDGDLVVQSPILLHGGMTEASLEMHFQLWRQSIEAIVKWLE